MALPTLPPPVELSSETKKAVIDGLKKVLEVFRSKGLLDAKVTYSDVIHDPAVLRNFIQVYRANRERVDDLVVSAENTPVRDDTTPLTCGVTLEQIQQLLVKTCAKFFFDKDKPEEETITETRTTKRFLFFTKTEQVERKASASTSDERKNRELVQYLAFDWQLPLLQAYKDCLTYQQLAEIGSDVIALQSTAAIEALGQFDPPTLRKAKSTASGDFGHCLARRPQAIAGIAFWNQDMYNFYRSVLKEKAWDFFAREKSFFNAVAELDKPLARVYGDTLCYMATENLLEMQRLNIDKVGVLIEALKTALGSNVPVVLSVPSFAKDILRKLVESLLHMNQEKEQLLVSAQLTCKAIAPQVIDWLAKQRAA